MTIGVEPSAGFSTDAFPEWIGRSRPINGALQDKPIQAESHPNARDGQQRDEAYRRSIAEQGSALRHFALAF